MQTILHIIQITSAVLLIVFVLLQRSSGDMGSAFGDTSFMHSRRGAERFFFILTIAIAIVFAASSIAVLVLAK